MVCHPGPIGLRSVPGFDFTKRLHDFGTDVLGIDRDGGLLSLKPEAADSLTGRRDAGVLDDLHELGMAGGGVHGVILDQCVP